MTLSIVAAIGKNNELGKKNGLLWRLPGDMRHFRELTRGHTVIMGQRTFESIGHPLPDRRNIVVTRNSNFRAPGAEVSHSLELTLRSLRSSNEEAFIIGGGEIYKQTIGKANRLYITHVDMENKDADTHFPEISSSIWEETSREEHKKDAENAYDFTFSVYERV